SIGHVRATAYLLIILDHACIHMFYPINYPEQAVIKLLSYIYVTFIAQMGNIYDDIKTCSYILKVHVYDSNRSKQHAYLQLNSFTHVLAWSGIYMSNGVK
ncbi:hypothetical protein ACJX0J_040283, partial [Zea mays]